MYVWERLVPSKGIASRLQDYMENQDKIEKNIKRLNRKWLLSYLIFHIIIFGLFSGILSLTVKDVEAALSRLKSPDGLFILIAYPLTIILEGILSSHVKAILVFLKLKNPLPGCRAFTKIGPKDQRIDMKKLRKLFPKGLPKEPWEQNQEWYKLYRKFSNKTKVFDVHKAFLLTRDIAAITAILIPATIIGHLMWGTPFPKITYHILFLAVMLIATILSSRNYGKGFVANVLLETILQITTSRKKPRSTTTKTKRSSKTKK